ncbi:GNAT family N-acetyltransferase [Desulfoluna spongiiphila]|uniref:GNAT family N-acetyltransferase n=1 Tax=Desulfoluna spongiiphila TaxID=419481 RepID=UPI0012537686|nr:GNAT family N-acetyltransferase [Desulfoluna spongiiphila]VVS93691.1 acyl-coa n-acyltransferase [Desulfoluna spongiiphila]
MSKVGFDTGGEELLGRVGPLWEKLKTHHAAHSVHFSEFLAGRTFADRTADILSHGGEVRVELAVRSGQDVGYCVCTISPSGTGEVDSLYVEEDFRGCGLGEALARRGLAWMDEKKVTRRSLSVVYGNDAALAFYHRLGFYPRNIQLDQLPASA